MTPLSTYLKQVHEHCVRLFILEPTNFPTAESSDS